MKQKQKRLNRGKPDRPPSFWMSLQSLSLAKRHILSEASHEYETRELADLSALGEVEDEEAYEDNLRRRAPLHTIFRGDS